MDNTGKCPKCGHTLVYVDTEKMDITVYRISSWYGISYICPDCHVILSVGIDPAVLKAEIVKEILDALQDQTP